MPLVRLKELVLLETPRIQADGEDRRPGKSLQAK